MPQKFVQNPLEQFEPENLPVGWPWRFFSVALIIFSSALLVYLGIIFGYQPYLRAQIQETDKQISQLLETVSKEDQENFTRFYSQLVNLKNLLDNHIESSKLFPFLEKITNKKVSYNNLNLRVPERELELEGLAESYAALGEQLESLSQSEEIERYLLNQSQLSGSLVQFKATLKLKSNLLK